jgi:hypothetical protein
VNRPLDLIDVLLTADRLEVAGIFDERDINWFVKKSSEVYAKGGIWNFYNLVFTGGLQWSVKPEEKERLERVKSLVKRRDNPWLQFSLQDEVDFDLLRPFQVTLEEANSNELWREAELYLDVYVMEREVQVKTIDTLDRLEMWDKVTIGFWMDDGLDVSDWVELLSVFIEANVTSEVGWRWFLDGLLNDYLMTFNVHAFPMLNWEDFILELSNVRELGLDKHGFFEVVNRVKRDDQILSGLQLNSHLAVETRVYNTYIKQFTT